MAKYVKEYEKARLQLLNNTDDKEGDTWELTDKIVEKPKYNN